LCRQRRVRRLRFAAGAQLLTLSATNFDGLRQDLRAVAAATNCSAEELIASLQARLGAVHQVVEDRSRPRVLTLEWSDPPFIGGHWVPEIVAAAGGQDVLGRVGELSRRATWDEIAASDPDVVLLLPCGYSLQETHEQHRALLAQSEYSNLRAVQNGNVWATDATHLFSRCTPQSVRAVEVVAGILHPQVCAPPLPDEALRCS
jgi:iron complex transport system substrate-binding protein